MSSVVEKIRVNGIGVHADLAEQIIDGELKLSTSSISAFDFTIMDRDDLKLTRQVGALFREGTTILYEGFALTLTGLETGGGTQKPTIQVSATSDFVRGLKDETGGQNWGDTDVSAWARDVIRRKGAMPYVQPNLGTQEIERREPEGDGVDEGESTWDVLVEMAKRTGSWLFEYGPRVVMARPSWLVSQTGVNRYKITWNTWRDHTDALVAAPQYSWNKDRKPYNGQEQLVIQAIDPPGSTEPLTKALPGDILEFDGAANPTDDPDWIVVSVIHPAVAGRPVSITCWRPIDPPEVLDDSKDTGEDGKTASGVPHGPLGKFGWQGDQLKNASEIVAQGQRMGLPKLAMQLAVACAMGESSLIVKNFGDVAGPDSRGLFQQRDTWGPLSDRLSPGRSAGLFYEALKAQDYRGNYNNGASSLPSSDIGVVYIGPGKTANAASVTIHRVQINADPYHYVKFWADAQTVVDACIAAGEAEEAEGGGGGVSAEMKQNISRVMSSINGRAWDLDGAYGAQCTDGAAKFIQSLTGIPMIQGHGKDYYNHPVLKSKFRAIPGFKNPQKGDIVSWSGTWGAYQNRPPGAAVGYGHVAVYSHSQGGVHYFQSQNPTPMIVQPLQTSGIIGLMRVKG